MTEYFFFHIYFYYTMQNYGTNVVNKLNLSKMINYGTNVVNKLNLSKMDKLTFNVYHLI